MNKVRRVINKLKATELRIPALPNACILKGSTSMCIYQPGILSEEIIKKFVPTRLSIKEISGVKYFCKSTKQNFTRYVGSGTRWLNLVKKYGRKNVKTLWISDWYHCPYEIQEVALHFSKENEIVESDKWANIKPENGLDGNFSSSVKGENHPLYNPTIFEFFNLDGRVFIGTFYELRNKYPNDTFQASITFILDKHKNGSQRSLGGDWYLSREDFPKKYTFIHVSGKKESNITRKEMLKIYPDIRPAEFSRLISGKPNKLGKILRRTSGWRIQ